MALTHKINTLKLLDSFLGFNEKADRVGRYSLLDMYFLLLLNEHPESSKTDLVELRTGDRATSKSFTDRPIERLMGLGYIDRTEHDKAATKSGNPRVTYSVSKAGDDFLKANYNFPPPVELPKPIVLNISRIIESQ